jgi:AcrR family transcriptional regulator
LKINREQILLKAFEQYLLHGYSGVSISVLQQQLNIGRATLYYYFKDKETLFKAILDKYFIEVVRPVMEMKEDVLVPVLIEKHIAMSKQVKDNILLLHNEQLSMSSFSALLLFAYTSYPEFRLFVKDMQQRNVEQWKTAIRNSVKHSDLKPDVNVEVLASLFTHIKNNYDVGLSPESTIDDAFLTESYYYIYNLVKNQARENKPMC